MQRNRLLRMSLKIVTLLAVTNGLAHAADLQPRMTTTGRPLVSEDFSAGELPATFRVLQSAGRFSVVEGALQAVSESGQERSTHGAIMVTAQDITVAFRMKFTKPGTLYIGVDGYNERHQGNTHLVRFSLTPSRMGWDQKLGGAESKHAIGEANRAARKAKQPLPVATREQLADPTFFRTEEIAAREIDCPAGEWHDVLLEVSGDDLLAQVDGEMLTATSSVAHGKKNRIGIGLTGRGTVLIDNVRIWENQRRPDWKGIESFPPVSGDARP